MTKRDATAIEIFKNWYKYSGHWVYETRAEALRVWVQRGIESLPDAPAGAAKHLAEWAA